MGLLDEFTKKVQQQISKTTPNSFKITDEEIKKILVANESFIDVIQQVVPISPMAVILTSDRIIVYKKSITKTDFFDFYFRDIRDVQFSSNISGGKLSIQADRGNNPGIYEVDKLSLDESKAFYSKLQSIEKEWYFKKRRMSLEEQNGIFFSGDSIQPENYNEDDIESKLTKLKNMFEKDLITEDEYKEKKAKILDQL